MKNFSAKTADFDSISISGEAPVMQSDLGTAPNQIPLNKDLGTLAYMDSSGVEDINADTIELREIAAEMSETAVDVFVYDTRKDSDGGAWRSRTSHTSWYNDELNTATRGGRREFPAVAVIVAEADKVTIYDGDDPDLSMWMVFEQGGSTAATANLIGPTQATSTSVSMLNGVILVTENTWGAGLISANFISEGFIHYWQASKKYNGNISQRNDSVGYSNGDNEVIVNGSGNDVAMTVLPNAPIDGDTGLPIPTIAVATDGGVSVIRDDGSVTNSSFSDKSRKVNFYNSYLFIVRDDANVLIAQNINELRNLEAGARTFNGDYFYYRKDASQSSNFPLLLEDGGGLVRPVESGNFGSYLGLTKIDSNLSSDGMGAWITSEYNTGWMPGDIKLATLSDTKIETVGEGDNPELITNGQFNSDVSGWTNIDPSGSPDATITWSNGTAQVFRPTGQNGRFYQAIDTIVGAEYFIQIGNYGGSNGGVFVADSNDPNSWNIIANNGAVIKDNNKHYFTAITTSTYIILNSSSENQSVTFDDISVKRSGELIINGTFDNGTTGWTDEDGLDISVVSGSLKLERDTSEGNNSYTYQSIKTTAGKRYVFSFDITGEVNGGRSFLARLGNSINSDELGSITLNSLGSYSVDFVATGSEHYITLVIDGGVTGNYYLIDNISIRLAEDDRSVNDNGLQVFGEITKSPVVPGADLVAYSGFSADNYLMQPYNSDLDFGTGDFCIMGWATGGGTGRVLLDRIGVDQFNLQGSPTDLTKRLYIYSGTNLEVIVGSASPINTGAALNSSLWYHIAVARKDGIVYVWINGNLVGQQNNSELIGDSDHITVLGTGIVWNTSSWNGSMALWRISATAPTSDQIAKIYRDEKVLFQDGAQATLYGTSDAVTALAYDDSGDLLHVGTASGRSVFNGLKRVDNTTTAVSTAISATEGLVIEQ